MRASAILDILSDNQATTRQLLERIASGDTEAVREVIETYGDLVWSLARRFTRSDADAEEAVNDIFVTLWRKADQYDPSIGPEVTFVSVLARRQLIDRWRSAARRPKTADLSHASERTANEHTQDTSEMSRRAFDAFSELEKDVQIALRLSIEFGCSHSSIAEMTDSPLGTVKTRIRRGLSQIRDRIKDGSTLLGAAK